MSSFELGDDGIDVEPMDRDADKFLEELDIVAWQKVTK